MQKYSTYGLCCTHPMHILVYLITEQMDSLSLSALPQQNASMVIPFLWHHTRFLGSSTSWPENGSVSWWIQMKNENITRFIPKGDTGGEQIWIYMVAYIFFPLGFGEQCTQYPIHSWESLQIEGDVFLLKNTKSGLHQKFYMSGVEGQECLIL